jgi:pheromone shutdown protein TraB
MVNQIVVCPEPGCEVAAEVVSRWVWPSTDGPIEHVKVFCLQGHARTVLSAWVVAPARPTRVAHSSARRN